MHTTEWDRDVLRETLREIMDRADLSQSTVGKLAGRDRTMANRWLKGQSRPTYEAATTLAAAIGEHYPALTPLAERFVAAAGYRPAEPQNGVAAEVEHHHLAAEQIIREWREAALREDKSIGDILVERGLATRDELTLSEEKRGDLMVDDILRSNLPEATKDRILIDYVGRRRHHYREKGLIGDPEAK